MTSFVFAERTQKLLCLALLLSTFHQSWPFVQKFYHKKHAYTRSRHARFSYPLNWSSGISFEKDATKAVEELIQYVEKPSDPDDQGLVLLFVSQLHARHFSQVVAETNNLLDKKMKFVAVVGGGVVGDGQEVDMMVPKASMSILSGVLPAGADVDLFSLSDQNMQRLRTKGDETPSYLLFVDPWAPTSEFLKQLEPDAVVVGGISCPINGGQARSTLAVNGKPCPQGSVVGMRFGGSVKLQAICAQACRPVGPIFTISESSNNAVLELDGVSALKQLESVASQASEKDKELIQSGGLLCGVSSSIGSKTIDFLARQVIGFQPKIGAGPDAGGAIVIATPVKDGDLFCFQVRDKEAAEQDVRVMTNRAKSERLFAGNKAGKVLAALQISCVARGQALFEAPNVDLRHVSELLQDDDTTSNKPVAGFFANGEIGPVGLAGFGSSTVGATHVHGFTTIAVLICDCSAAETDNEKQTISESFGEQEAWG